MPKDEFDFDDPMELNGVSFLTEEDTTDAMAECFVEEFLRLGHNHQQILALFRNPHYTGMNMVLQNRGEAFVREVIAKTFAIWGRPFEWDSPGPAAGAVDMTAPSTESPAVSAPRDFPADALDPMGVPAPKFNL